MIAHAMWKMGVGVPNISGVAKFSLNVQSKNDLSIQMLVYCAYEWIIDCRKENLFYDSMRLEVWSQLLHLCIINKTKGRNRI